MPLRLRASLTRSSILILNNENNEHIGRLNNLLEVTQWASAVVLGFLSLVPNHDALLYAREGVSSGWSVCTSGAILNCCLTRFYFSSRTVKKLHIYI